MLRRGRTSPGETTRRFGRPTRWARSPRVILARRHFTQTFAVSKPGRNDPCPCGSGRKFKLCCGAVVIAVAAPGLAQNGARQCGECTACCQGWAEGEIRGHRMFAGQHCHFLQQGACSIYDQRPQSPCRNFVCSWLADGSPFPDEYRPDKVGVIIVPMRWRERAAYVLLSAGNDAPPEMLAWMKAFAQRTGSPFYYQQNGERLGFGPPAFQQEMLDKVQGGQALW